MPRLLYIWEYGSDLGHINSFLPIAKKLKALNWEIVCAIPQQVAGIAEAKVQIERLDADCLATPGAPILGLNSLKSESHVDMLRQLTGLRDESEFGFYLDSWLSILHKEKPDLVICDYSVVGLIAANSLQIPTIVIDQGWFVPDLSATEGKQSFSKLLYGFTSLEREQNEITRIENKESETLEFINRQLKLRELPCLEKFLDIYQSKKLILNTFHELSPLPHKQQSSFIGCFEQHSEHSDVAWPKSDCSKPNIFVYLKKNTPVLNHILSSLANNNKYSVIAYIPGINPAFLKPYLKEHITFSDSAVNLNKLLNTTNLVISNAGTGLISQSLLSGVPLIMVPQWTEQQFNAKRVQQLYAGESINYSYSEKEVAAVIERVLGNQIYLAKAREFKLNHAFANLDDIVNEITSIALRDKAKVENLEKSDDNYVVLSELDWFYLYHNELDSDLTWDNIKTHIPHAIPIQCEDFWLGIDTAAQLAKSERFLSIKQGCSLDPYLFIAEAEYPAVQQHTHWYWNTLNELTGLVFGSSDVMCWNASAIKAKPLSSASYTKNTLEMHTLLRRPEFSSFARVLSNSHLAEDNKMAFFKGYKTTLKMVDAFSGDVSRIIQYPSSTLVRRLFIHMSADQEGRNKSYYVMGARLAFVNQFIRFKKGFDSINLGNIADFVADALLYTGSKSQSPLHLDDSELNKVTKFLGDKIRNAHSKPPLLDMDTESANGFKNALQANRVNDHHLFSPYSSVAAL